MSTHHRQKSIDDLFASMQETLELFDGARTNFGKRYAPGKWSVLELLVHISDAETVLLDRLRRIASEKQPALIAFDQDLWVANLFYDKRDLHVVKMQYQAARRSVIELATLLPASVDEKTGIHSEVGPITFAQVLEKINAHNVHHLAQIKAAVAGVEWKKA